MAKWSWARLGWACGISMGLLGCAAGAGGLSMEREGDDLDGDPPSGRVPVTPPAAGASGMAGASAAGSAAGASGSAAEAGTGGSGGAAGATVLPGEACERGQSADCTCEDGVSTGTKECEFDASSPTMGAFGPCTKCVAPEPMPGAGRSGSGGTGGSGNGAGGAGGMAGSGMAGSGAAGSAPPPAPGAVMCGSTTCAAPPPLLGLVPQDACCTDQMTCGMLLLNLCL